jgi:hypothetical protein
MPLAFMGVMVLAATTISAVSLAADCPPAGDSPSPAVGAANVLRNRTTIPAASDIDSNATLNALLFPGEDLGRWSNSRGAKVMGFVVDVKPGGLDSANCHAERATVIELGLHQHDPRTERLMAVLTPSGSAAMAAAGTADWSMLAVRHRLIGRWVRITGWLFGDWERKAESENTNSGNPDNSRATIWEIHPVTDIQVLNSQAAANLPSRPSIE